MRTLKQLTDESMDDTEFTVKTLETTIMSNSNNYSKWLGYLTEEGLRLKKINLESASEYSRLYKHYRWSDEADMVRGEIPDIIKGEASYQTIMKKLEISKQKLVIIEGTLKAITGLGFNIKTYIEYEKLKNGSY